MTTPAPDSLGLCILTALWEGDPAAADVLELYKELREEDWGEPENDGVAEVNHQIEALGGPGYWAELVKKKVPGASTRAEVLRATVLVEACELLTGAEVQTSADLRGLDAETVEHLERSWKRMAGQRSGESFRRLLELTKN